MSPPCAASCSATFQTGVSREENLVVTAHAWLTSRLGRDAAVLHCAVLCEGEETQRTQTDGWFHKMPSDWGRWWEKRFQPSRSWYIHAWPWLECILWSRRGAFKQKKKKEEPSGSDDVCLRTACKSQRRHWTEFAMERRCRFDCVHALMARLVGETNCRDIAVMYCRRPILLRPPHLFACEHANENRVKTQI